MASIYGFSIKNHKTFQGRDWQGDQGDICYNGKKVGWYNNDGNGGCADIDFFLAGEKRAEYEQLLKEATEKYYQANPMTGQFKDLTPDGELFFGELLTLSDKEKQYKSMNKKGYPLTLMYSTDDFTESIVGFKTKEASEKYITEKAIKGGKVYESLADFIIQ